MSTHCVMFFVLMYVGSVCAGSGRDRAGVDDESRFLRTTPVVAQAGYVPGVPFDWADLPAASQIEMTGRSHRRVEDSASCCGRRQERTLGDEECEEWGVVPETGAGMDADDEGAARGGGAAADFSGRALATSEDEVLYLQETPELRSARESRVVSPVPKSATLESLDEELKKLEQDYATTTQRLTVVTASVYFLQNSQLAAEMKRIFERKKKYLAGDCVSQAIVRNLEEISLAESLIEKDSLETKKTDLQMKINTIKQDTWRTDTRQPVNFAPFESIRKVRTSVPGLGPVVDMSWREAAASSIDDDTRDYIRTKIQQNLSYIDHQVFDSHGVGADTHGTVVFRIREYNVTSQLSRMRAFLTHPDIARFYDAAYDGCSEISGKDALVESKEYFNAIVSKHNDVVLPHNMSVLEYRRIDLIKKVEE